MSIALFLNLGAGSLSSGFDRITSRLEVDGKLIAQLQGSLPGNTELQDLCYQWQFYYAAYYDNYPDRHPVRGDTTKIELDSAGVTGFSVTSFDRTSQQLGTQMRDWLDRSSFSTLAEPLLWHIGALASQPERLCQHEVIIIIESADDRIYRLPWHCWSALAACPQAEITFSLNTYQRQVSTSCRTKPRILAVFGDRTGIDTAADAEFIQQLQADLVTLIEPSIAQLRHQLEDRQGWDILFFAGHSSDLQAGTIQLNSHESVTLNDFRHALTAAIGHGLKLAIFNSCSGLGVATSLAALDIPTAIVMREAIPNRVAQDFLQTFLHSFESGKSLLVAVAAAKRRLQALEADFPCATWLPVVFWNPTVELPTWRSFYPPQPPKMSLWKLGAIVLATTAAIWGVRSQGYLEQIELATYDVEMHARAIEPPDDRLTIVRIEQNSPVSDRILFRALQKLQQYHPKAIGLDIYRDLPVGEGQQDLDALLQQQHLIISSCLMSGNPQKFPGVPIPPGVPPAHVGFTNFSLDPDGAIRRQVLGMAAVDGGCTTDHSLSLRLALKYLDIPAADEAEDGNLKIGNRQVAVLGTSFAGYRSTHSRDNLRGFQMMLNYRNTPQIAPELSLDRLLTDDRIEASIANKIVLIGYTGRDNVDRHSLGKRSQIPGVMVHAQMTSNLLSHILDDRALITTWTDIGEFGWILLWGTVGGASWFWLRGYKLWIVHIGAVVAIVASCEVYLSTRSVWIPLIPSEMALILTPVVAMGVHRWQIKSADS